MKAKRRAEVLNKPLVDWRSKAAEMLPELVEEIAEAINPMELWIEMGFAFDASYKEPRNEDLIRRIYGFADWCLEQPQTDSAEDDLPTNVIIGFYEDIPRNKAAREDMPRWFTLEDIVRNKAVFSYHISEAEYEELKALFGSAERAKQKKPTTAVHSRKSRPKRK